MAKLATRGIQTPVDASPCGFESHLQYLRGFLRVSTRARVSRGRRSEAHADAAGTAGPKVPGSALRVDTSA